MCTYVDREAHSRLFTEASFTTAKTQKLPQCLRIGNQIPKWRWSHTVEHYTAKKKNKPVTCTSMEEPPGHRAQREVRHKRENMIPFKENRKPVKMDLCRWNSASCVCWGVQPGSWKCFFLELGLRVSSGSADPSLWSEYVHPPPRPPMHMLILSRKGDGMRRWGVSGRGATRS